MEKFAFTLKFTNKPDCKPSDYRTLVIDKWALMGIVFEEYTFEADKKGVCHVHGILKLKRHFYRKNLKAEGLHYKLVPLYREDGWLQYIRKDQRLVLSNVNLLTQEGSFGSVPSNTI